MLISNKEHLSSLLQNAESFKNVAQSTRAGALASTIESVDIRNRLSLRKHPFLLALRRCGRSSAQNVPSDEERGETDVFAG